MGSLVPSSPELARRIVALAEIRPGHRVLELGAGSGAFTAELRRAHADAPLVAVEPARPLALALARVWPEVTVLAAPAEDLAAHLPAGTRFDRVVSGLPWALWSEARQASVLDAITPFLATDARLVTFHYVHSDLLGAVRTTRRLFRARFHHTSWSPVVWQNAPPAKVHVAEGLRGG